MPKKESSHFVTTGKHFYPTMHIPLVIEKNNNSFPIKVSDRLQIILIEGGTGVLKIINNNKAIHSPMLILLRENEEFITDSF